MARAIGTLSCRGIRKHWKPPRWYGILSYSTQENHQGGDGIWTGSGVAHPHQAWFSSLDEVAMKFTLLINLGDNWPYTFVWLNEDAQHVPLSNEGHLSTMVDGVPCRSTCRHLHWLEVCKLLQCGEWVVYHQRDRWGMEPVQTSLLGSLIWGMDMLGKPAHKPSFLLVDLSWVTPGDHMPKVPTPCRTLTPPSSPHSAIIPAAQPPTLVWMPSFTSSCFGPCWTTPAQPQGALCWGDQHQWPWLIS